MTVTDGGSPGRIRTSDMTVNSRPLYRLSYRGVVSEILLLSAWHREIKRWRIDIIASGYVYESIGRVTPAPSGSDRLRCRLSEVLYGTISWGLSVRAALCPAL